MVSAYPRTVYRWAESFVVGKGYSVERGTTYTNGKILNYDIFTARASVVTSSYEGLEEVGHELYLEGEREGYDIVVVDFSVDEGYGVEPAETYVFFANPDLEEIYYDRMDPEHESLKGN